MTVSEYIFHFLEEKGCKNVFMVSGSSAMWLTDALKRNQKLNTICCQHEQAAAMAADGTGRSAHVPGVCLVTIGPGATNAITGVAGAYVDSSPMFVLSGQANSKLLKYQMDTQIRQNATQCVVLENMVSDITKYFAVIMNEKDIRYHMECAYAMAMSGRKGPVWIDVPVDIQNRQVPEDMEGYTKIEQKEEPFYMEPFKQLLKESERPLILAGYGVLSAGVEDRLIHFSERYHIPIVTSRAGIGAIESSHPLFIGRPGSYGDRASHFAIQECDLLLILGSRLSVSTIGYYPDRFGLNAKKIMVDIDEKELEKSDVPIDMKVQMDLRTFIDRLSELGDIELKSHADWVCHCNKNKEMYPTVRKEYEQEEGINGYYFTKELSKYASGDYSVVVDTGSVCNIVSQAWELKKGQKYIISGGLSCMGFWASSLGVAAESGKVIALSGDGSTQMNIQDFATLSYYKLPVKLFVYNNHGYLLIRHNQHNYMDDRFLGVGADSGVPSIDFCRIADAYGLPSVCIRDKSEIHDKVKQVLEHDGPMVCEVMVQEFGTLAPRIASKVMPDGSLKAAEFDDLWPFLEK